MKQKTKENKVYKWFRHLASLGVGGALAYLFPNVLLTNLSMLSGYLAGKGIITFGTAMAISTFLGSAAGLLIQQALIAGISYLFTNVILKQTGKIARKIATKVTKKEKVPESQPTITHNTQKQSTKVATPIVPTTPAITKPKVKTLGVDPRTRR